LFGQRPQIGGAIHFGHRHIHLRANVAVQKFPRPCREFFREFLNTATLVTNNLLVSF
jgi:hypothetical protein